MGKKTARVLITGGAGYIGSLLTPLFLSRGFSVTVLDNFLHKQASLLDCCYFKDFEIVRGDARDEGLLKELLKKADIIIPLAALVGVPLCNRDPVAARTTNLGAIRSLVRLSSKSQWILLPVSNSGYGIGEKDKFCTEESPLRPLSLYGRTKVEAEEAVLKRGNAVAFRLATAFGVSTRMRMDLLVNDFVYRAVRDRAVVIFEGHFKRNYIHVRDIARVFLHGMDHFKTMKDKTYNVGLDNANLSKLELCRLIQSIIPGFVYVEAPVGEDPDKRDYVVSNARILSTGFKPEWDLERGIRELIKCYNVLRGVNPYANA